MNFTIKFSGHLLLFISVLVFALGLIIWLYYRTVPALSAFYRFILIFFRTVAIILIILVLFSSVLHIKANHLKSPEIIFLIDNSASMQIKDNDKFRSDIIRNLLKSSDIQVLKEKFNIREYVFSDTTYEIDNFNYDSLLFNGMCTNLGRALEYIGKDCRKDRVEGIFIFSDGSYNVGDNPVRIAKKLKIPIFSVAVGDTAEKPDIILIRVLVNDITYQDNNVTAVVGLRGPGYGGKKVTVRLKKGKQVFDKKNIILPRHGLETTLKLNFILKEPGFERMSVEIDNLEGELTENNNHKKFYIKVLKSKMKILLLASQPCPDLAFLKRVLSSDKDAELTVLTEKMGGGFYERAFPEQSEIKKIDVIILLDYPSSSTSSIIWETVKSEIINNHKSFMLFTGENIDCSKINSIQNIMPGLLKKKFKALMVTPEINPDLMDHPLLKITENREENRQLWEKLPPVFFSAEVLSQKSGSSLLCEGIAETYSGKYDLNRYPLIYEYHLGDNKSILFLGYGFYRWDLVMWGLGTTNELLRGFIGNSIRWLCVRDQGDNIQLVTNKHIYRQGEKVFFSVQVYDELYHRVKDGNVRLLIDTPSGRRVQQLRDKSEGKYKGGFSFFETGKYAATAEASFHDRILGRGETEFSVTDYNPEFIDTKADHRLLSRLSYSTGGQCIKQDSLVQFIEKFNFKPEIVEVSREVEIFRNPWILVLIVLFLSVDWFIRKQKGLL